MTKRQLDGLQAIMSEEQIIRIAHWNGFYSVAMKGDILGTGLTLADAYNDALTFKKDAA